MGSRIPAGSRRLGRRPSLSAWFAALSFVCIAAVSATSAVLLTRFLRANMLEHDAVMMAEVVQGLVDVQDPRDYFTHPGSGTRDRAFQEFFFHISRLPDVLRTNIYGLDQRVLWSSDPALIGQILGPNHELEEAIEGKVAVETGTIGAGGGKPEHERLKSQEPRFVENYVPVRTAPGGPVIGVVELYRVPTALFGAIERGVRLIWIAAICAGVLIYAVLFGFVLRADRLLARQRERLLETETLAVVGEMTGAITHGIRNPLASIRTSAELLYEDGLPETRSAARDIMAEVDRLSEWVRQLLTYSDQEPGKLTRVSLGQILDAALTGFAREFQRRGVQLHRAFDPELPNVQAEPVRLTHVFNSLIANAVEAMPQGGTLRVGARAQDDGRCVEVTLRDSGAGVAADDLPRVFMPFFTTKRKGLGLGLPLVKRIITRFGGSIAMASEPGLGTEVRVRLKAS